MKIFLCNFDDATGRSRLTSLQSVLPDTECTVQNFGGTSDLNESWRTVVSAADTDSVLALVHVSKLSLAKLVELSNGSALPEKLALILFSGGGVGEGVLADSDLSALQFQSGTLSDRAFLYRASFSSGFPQDILDAVTAFLERRFHEFVRGFSLSRHEQRLAYRLLREASDFCGEDASRRFADTGLTLHAPKSLQDWWKPFDEDEAKALRVLSRCIVDDGDPGDSGPWNNVKTHLSGSGARALKSAVAEFLKVPDTETAQR